VTDGIPVLLPDPDAAGHDELDHAREKQSHGDADHKTGQADYFDRGVAEEFEIARPHGTPGLYSFLLAEKLRRATAPIGRRLDGATALTVCGGSGMDAEFAARAGARVISSDLSLGAARRTRERARRFGLDITPIVADIEHLPFPDASIDLVLVHDGLHHLECPEVGLAEMARVARKWVSVSEPAQAAATGLAVRLGLAQRQEAAGNRVARLRPSDVAAFLSSAGFRPLASQRYVMYYRHEPGSIFRLLSGRSLLPFTKTGWRAGNAVFGRVGNKMVVVAEREVSPSAT
jgi:SAM-dependent methyltransferase